MEGAYPHGAAVDVLRPSCGQEVMEQFIQPAAHFARGFVGESHRHNGIGRYLLDLDQPGDTVHQHPCFTATRARQDQLVGSRCGNSGALGVIKGIKEQGNIHNLGQRAKRP